jgi:hypothetical protein
MAASTWQQFNCYDVLRIPPSSGPKEIRYAYLQRCKETHPDVGGTHEQQVRVNLTYEVLSDPIQRQSHDRYWIDTAKTFSFGKTYQDAGAKANYHTKTHSRPTAEQAKSKNYYHTHFGSLYRRVYERIQKARQGVESSRAERTVRVVSDYVKIFNAARKSKNTTGLVSLALTAIAFVASASGIHFIWIAAIIGWLSFINQAQGVVVGSIKFKFDDENWHYKISKAAGQRIDQECQAEIDALQKYLRHIGSITELLERGTTFDDSEEQVARRLTAAFFLMGYQPVHFDREARIIVFTDGEEKLVIRFRHRSGVATNVAYVKRMVEEMRSYGSKQGYLFCTPGLTGNCADLAKQKGIKCYSLETMNNWLSETCRADYQGPEGDIFSLLDSVMEFVGKISLSIPYPFRRRYRRYY